MKNISFLFGIHIHQPIGNLEEILEKAYQKSYLPFLEVLFDHPAIKWNLHCTGILWEWMEKHHPDYLEKVQIMIDRNQLELLSGGFYEPILSILPDPDKVGQIRKLNEYLEKRFKVQPQGMWCAERVWEPHLPKPIRQAQIRYTVLDDTHFLSAGCSENQLNGYYKVEEQNDVIDIFPISQELRYLIPFSKPEDSIEFFRKRADFSDHKGHRAALIMADDGEKFGLWPETFQSVYKEMWLEKFLTLLEKNSSWIKTETFSEYRKENRAIGKISLPTSSYFEMSEWSLPTESGSEFQEALELLHKRPDSSRIKRFFKGGIWRNFFSKYPESNSMYKKMLRVSQKVHQLEEKFPSSKLIGQALNSLWAGQCNCAYWHGVFGGLYLPILRQAIYKNLIEAEKFLDSINLKEKNFFPQVELYDFDGDGEEEIIIETPTQNLYLSPKQGGSIFEWDFKPASVNLSDVLTRRPEVYHKKLKVPLSQNEKEGSGVTKSIHHLRKAKEEGLENIVFYDWYRRANLTDHFLHPSTTEESFMRCQYGEQGDFVLGEYEYEILKRKAKNKELEESSSIVIKLFRKGAVWVQDKKSELLVEKTLRLMMDRSVLQVHYRVHNFSTEWIEDLWFAPEFNFSFSVPDKEPKASFTNRKQWQRANPYLFWKLTVDFSDFTDAWIFPLETVSNSENGFEKTFQGTVFVPHWKFSLKRNHSFERTLTFTIEKI